MLHVIETGTTPPLAHRRTFGVKAALKMRRVIGAIARGRVRPLALPAALLTLGACAATVDQTAQGEPVFIEELPASVVALAEPNQDLTAVRLLPQDGCYWYRYTGPVETTMLPLRTAEGERICTGSYAGA